MVDIVAQVTPQRSTQYTEFVTALAPYELELSLVGLKVPGAVETIKLGTHTYLRFQLETEPDDLILQALDNLATTDSYFTYYDEIERVQGPFLKPMDVPANNFLPPSLIATRRYRGKTNEVLTQFMCNVAKFSSDFRSTPWHKITLVDPLAGGGTTLFVGLTLGADVGGVEKDKKVAAGTVAFLKQYMREARISAQFREDKLKNVGKRWFITIDKTARCVVGQGDTSEVGAFFNGLKRPQLIVTDLPYGIQHRAQWQTMLASALPAWSGVLADGGVLAFAWNATHFPREDMISLVQDVSNFTVIDDPPYDRLAHRVDRVIKKRDLIVAR